MFTNLHLHKVKKFFNKYKKLKYNQKDLLFLIKTASYKAFQSEGLGSARS